MREKGWLVFRPQPDITTYELALAVANLYRIVTFTNNIFTRPQDMAAIPEEIKRHFEYEKIE